MKTNQLRWTLRLLLFNAALVVLVTGCATPNENSYNQDFNQNLPTSPKYVITDLGESHFKLTVHQGSPLTGNPQRVIYVKEAASLIAETECKRRGWQNWKFEYIQERDQGWMHIVIADVTRKTPIELPPAQPGNNP